MFAFMSPAVTLVENSLYKNYHPLEQIKILRFHAFIAFFLVSVLQLLFILLSIKLFTEELYYVCSKKRSVYDMAKYL